jgi:NACalpha-BTF3-like transcription factor
VTETKAEEGVRERTLVDVTSAEDIKYWTEQFGANEDELRAAVEAVGKDVAAVEARLKKHDA